MLSDEAAPLSEPLRLKTQKKFRKTLILVAYIIFVVLVSLGVNNYIIYSWYKDTRAKYEDTFLRIQTIAAENSSLISKNSSMTHEYSLMEDEFKKISAQNEQIAALIEDIKNRNYELMDKNKQLEEQNKELSQHNIELQNSLKKAASVGIKPQSFTEFQGISSRGEVERGQYLGKFLGTAYTPCSTECGNNLGITNSGQPIIPGVSIAIDKKYWPFGTVFYIKGLGYAVAMDTGSAIKGKNRFDFAVFDRNFANKLGTGYWDVYLVKMGNGKVEDVSL
jgi:3D (Asp-Asp-Asp) domain-containing protein